MLATDITRLQEQNSRQRIEIFSLKKETFRYVGLIILSVTVAVIMLHAHFPSWWLRCVHV